MNGDVITFFKNLIDIKDVNRIVIQVPRRFDRKIRIIPVNLHAEMVGGVCHHDADRAKPDHTKRFPLDFRPGESAFSFFHHFADFFAVAFQRFGPFDPRNHPAGTDEQPRDHQFLHRVGIGARRIEYHNTLFRATVNRDIIRPCTGTRNGFQGFRKRLFMQGGGTHDRSVGVFYLVPDGVLVIKLPQTAFGNFIIGFDLKHYAFSSSNFCMNATNFSTPSIGMAL